MAYTAILTHDGSRSLSRERPGELSQYADVGHLVYSGSGGVALADALGATGLPAPKSSRGLTLNGSSYVCMKVEVNPHPTHANDYVYKATYATRVNPEIPFVKVTRTAGVRLADQYRRFSALPTSGAASFPPVTADRITGTAIDINGTPAVRYRVPTQVITVEVMYDAPVVANASTTAVPDYEAEAATYAFKRNSAAFLGWGIGKVLFEGADESPVDDIWRVRTFRFTADAWAHLEQRIALHINGGPILDVAAVWADGFSTAVKQTTRVYWYQPFPDLAAFASLVPAGVLSEIATPTPAL